MRADGLAGGRAMTPVTFQCGERGEAAEWGVGEGGRCRDLTTGGP